MVAATSFSAYQALLPFAVNPNFKLWQFRIVADDLIRSRYCKFWERSLYYDPLRFSLCALTCSHPLRLFNQPTSFKTAWVTAALKFLGWLQTFTHASKLSLINQYLANSGEIRTYFVWSNTRSLFITLWSLIQSFLTPWAIASSGREASKSPLRSRRPSASDDFDSMHDDCHDSKSSYELNHDSKSSDCQVSRRATQPSTLLLGKAVRRLLQKGLSIWYARYGACRSLPSCVSRCICFN